MAGAREYMERLLQQLHEEVRETSGPGATLSWWSARARLEGAAVALREAGLLADGDYQYWSRELDERLRADGWLHQESRTVSVSSTATASLSYDTASRWVPSEPLERRHARLKRVVALDTPFATIHQGTLTGISLQLWTTGTVLTLAAVGKGAAVWAGRGMQTQASDDLGTDYGPAGSFEPMDLGGVVLRVIAFETEVPDAASHLVLRVRVDGRTESLVIDLD